MSGDNGVDDGGVVEELDDDGEEVVVLIDEDGQEHQFMVLAVVEVGDQEYAMLATVEQLEQDDGTELELFLFQYDLDGEGNEMFTAIEDDSTFEKVRELCSNLMEVENNPPIGEA